MDSALCRILAPDSPGRKQMLAGYRDMRARLGSEGAAATTARLITADLRQMSHK